MKEGNLPLCWLFCGIFFALDLFSRMDSSGMSEDMEPVRYTPTVLRPRRAYQSFFSRIGPTTGSRAIEGQQWGASVSFMFHFLVMRDLVIRKWRERLEGKALGCASALLHYFLLAVSIIFQAVVAIFSRLPSWETRKANGNPTFFQLTGYFFKNNIDMVSLVTGSNLTAKVTSI